MGAGRLRELLVTLATLALAIAVSGCGAYTPISTAASMRVEVEVYKGPLSKDPEIQWGELVGAVNEASEALDQLLDTFEAVEGKREEESKAVISAIVTDIKASQDLIATARISANAFNLRYYTSTQTIPKFATGNYSANKDSAQKIENLAGQYRLNFAAPRPAGKSESTDKIENEKAAKNIAEPRVAESKTTGEKAAKKKATEEIAAGCDRSVPAANEVQEAANGLSCAIYDFQLTQTTTKRKDSESELKVAKRALETARIIYAAVNLPKPPIPGAENKVEMAQIRAALYGVLTELASAAQQFRAKALYWSTSHVGFALAKGTDRRYPVTFATLLTTYADRLGLKADSLIKQVKGDDRRELPLSVAQRETTAPAYLNQYLWNRAGGNVGGPGDLFDPSYEGTRDRVSVINRLFTDENWSNINTVYAGGQGTVRMALIKDDIGNWNLKSFDQDPSALLDAYKNVGLSAIAIATKAAEAAATGGSVAAAQQSLQIASQFAFGAASGGSPTFGSNNVGELHSAALAKLNALRTDVEAKQKKLTSDIETQTTAATAAKSNADTKAAKLAPLVASQKAADAAAANADAAKATQVSLTKSIDDKNKEIAATAPDDATKRAELQAAVKALTEELANQKRIEGEAREAAQKTSPGPALAQEQAEFDTAKLKQDEAEAALKKSKDALQNLGTKTASDINEILQTQANVLDLLQNAAVSGQPGSAKPDLQGVLDAAKTKK